MTEPEKFHTVKEVAEMFSVSQYTIREWIRSKKLPAIKLPGGSLRVSDTEINKLANAKYGE